MDNGLHERDMSQMSNLIHLATERSNSLQEVIMSAQSGVWPGPMQAKYKGIQFGSKGYQKSSCCVTQKNSWIKWVDHSTTILKVI